MFQRVTCFSALALVLFTASVLNSKVVAQTQDGALLDLIVSTVRRSSSADLAPNQIDRIRPLVRSQSIPNLLVQDENFKESLSVFDHVPNPDGSLAANREKISAFL